MTLSEAIERRNKLQATLDALLMGERVVEVKFDDHTVTYQQGNIRAIKEALHQANMQVQALSGQKRGRPSKILHRGGYWR